MSFITEDFLLYNPTGRRLYHEVARELPIVDYHNHLSPELLAENSPFEDPTELFIRSDPYKHRAMRMHGVPEGEITGDVGSRQLFDNWAATVPAVWGNPLHHWNALELHRVFGIEEPLSPQTAAPVWQTIRSRLQEDGFTPQGILTGFGVQTLCTSDDLLSDLTHHRRATAHGKLEVYPSLRGDTITGIDHHKFLRWLARLVEAAGTEVTDLDSYLAAVSHRLEDFAAAGCVLADHALNSGFRFYDAQESNARRTFDRVLRSEANPVRDIEALKSYLLVALGRCYAKRGWGMQLHVGAQRRTSARLRTLAGSAGGYASIGSPAHMESLAGLLDTIEGQGGLPDIVLYTLNPADNAAFGSLTGSFTEDGRPGKVQFGPAWWYNDQLGGIRDHLQTVANYGLLHHFIGMTTDSRSVMSFSRHEYFRRILCNLLGEWVETGHLPPSGDWLDQAVTNLCHGNARRWLDTKQRHHAQLEP